MNICYISLKNDGIKKAKYIVLINLHKKYFNTCVFPFLAFSQLPLMDLSSNPENIKKFRLFFLELSKDHRKFSVISCVNTRDHRKFSVISCLL